MKIIVHNTADDRREYDTPAQYDSMLEMLKGQRIFKLERNDDQFNIAECCDFCFDINLTREQLRGLGEEIIALSEAK
jgi:hypothetical protein